MALAFATATDTVALPREYFNDCNVNVVSAQEGNSIQLARQRDVLL